MSYTYGTGANANYSGRPLVYPDQVPFDTDILREAQYRLVDIANLAQAVLGLPSTFGGSYPSLSSGICTQQASPNMTVNLGVCTIYSLQQMEPIAYGNLGPLTSPLIFKQFTNMVAVSSGTMTAPTAGNWMYYLIQGTPNTVQINSVSRPYYNASNPSSPNFNTADDTEIDNITFALVPGTPSSKTGPLPAIPVPTGSGIGMFLVLVSDTTTTITNSLISGYPGSFIGTTLPNIPGAVQNDAFNFVTDVSVAANTITINPVKPLPTAYTAGMKFNVVIANTNTGATVVNVAGLGNKALTYSNTDPLVGNECVAGGIAQIEYDGTRFQLLNAVLSSAVAPVTSNVPFASSVSINSGTIANVTSILVPAGNWLLSGNITFTSLGATPNGIRGWISSVSATTPDLSNLMQLFPISSVSYGLTVPSMAVTVTTPTTYYLSGSQTSGSTAALCGNLIATPL